MNTKTYDAILLLGLRLVNGEAPQEELKSRVRTAAAAFREGCADKIIACGGKFEPHEKTEAEVMEALLADEGIDKNAVVREDKSKITYENIQNAALLLQKKRARVLVVTSDYHARRARLLCRMMGMRAKSLACKTPDNEEKRAREKLERLLIIDTLLGNQRPGKKRGRITAFLGRIASGDVFKKLSRPQPDELRKEK